MAPFATVLEKLASCVPGYSGYAEREKRRDTDQALRRSVASRLSDLTPVVDRLVAEALRTMRLEALEPLDSLKRRLSRAADAIGHATAGYAGLFDARDVDAKELDRLTDHDRRLREAVEELSQGVRATSLDAIDGGRAVEEPLLAVESALRTRDEILKGVV